VQYTNEPELNVRLPVINLPTFSGSFDAWIEFRDSFNSLINKNKSLSGLQKFHYLKSSLKGDAESILHNLEISPNSYTIA
jgi:hypothetical protein